MNTPFKEQSRFDLNHIRTHDSDRFWCQKNRCHFRKKCVGRLGTGKNRIAIFSLPHGFHCTSIILCFGSQKFRMQYAALVATKWIKMRELLTRYVEAIEELSWCYSIRWCSFHISKHTCFRERLDMLKSEEWKWHYQRKWTAHDNHYRHLTVKNLNTTYNFSQIQNIFVTFFKTGQNFSLLVAQIGWRTYFWTCHTICNSAENGLQASLTEL